MFVVHKRSSAHFLSTTLFAMLEALVLLHLPRPLLNTKTLPMTFQRQNFLEPDTISQSHFSSPVIMLSKLQIIYYQINSDLQTPRLNDFMKNSDLLESALPVEDPPRVSQKVKLEILVKACANTESPAGRLQHLWPFLHLGKSWLN